MQMGLSGLIRQRKTTRRLRMFSKKWSPGDTLHAFYKVYKTPEGTFDIVAGGIWGYAVNDMKALRLKTTFIPALCEFDEQGNPIGNPDVLYRFSRLAPYFVKGAYEKEMDNVQRKDFGSTAAQREALKQIEEKYDTKNNVKAIKPVVSRADILIVTEATVIQYKDGNPVDDSADVVMQPVSNNLADRLYSIINSPAYRPTGEPLDDGSYLVEIEWAFPMETEKSVSGRKVVPTGVTEEFRLANQFPDSYNKLLVKVGGMSENGDMIIKRSTTAVSEAKILSAISMYCTMKSEDLEGCSLNDELDSGLEANVDLLCDLKVTNVYQDEKIVRMIEEAKKNKEEENPAPDAAFSSQPEPSQKDSLIEAPTIEELIGAQDKGTEEAEQNTAAFLEGIDLSELGGDLV